ncbi:hypothetical protein LCGC14_0347280 [marine sediment metagenome]|uniref:Uncharacterized protein n=1 Tax=marine sediment metagenome TaxID=412755 RepID=A0A0F9VZ03_9ZZZZ
MKPLTFLYVKITLKVWEWITIVFVTSIVGRILSNLIEGSW